MSFQRYLSPLVVLAIAFAASGTASAQELPPMEREVSPKVAKRLQLAAQAIRFVKRGIPNSGNQQEALLKTQGNSHYRMKLARTTSVGSRTPENAGLAAKDSLAAKSAVIACTSGGNCGENATLALHFLKGLGTGQTLTKAGVEGVDHAFVLIGDLKNDPLHEIVVVDTWVTHSQPLLYTDFVFKKDRAQIRTFETATTKGKAEGNKTRQNRRKMTKALRVSMKKNPSPLMTQTTAKPNDLPGIWNQPHAANYKFSYVTKDASNKTSRVKFTQAFSKDIPKDVLKAHRTGRATAATPRARTPRVRATAPRTSRARR